MKRRSVAFKAPCGARDCNAPGAHRHPCCLECGTMRYRNPRCAACQARRDRIEARATMDLARAAWVLQTDVWGLLAEALAPRPKATR